MDPSKRDLPSYGMEDQFSKNEYMQHSSSTRQGLHETRLPGHFTPRKIDGHPAANETIVSKWTTNIDLTNRALRGIA